ncbi:MAG: hypothetical protein LUD44_07775 [Firmicutes bacterium]|nr:hypothetical protein [Bacillota bacterium]
MNAVEKYANEMKSDAERQKEDCFAALDREKFAASEKEAELLKKEEESRAVRDEKNGLESEIAALEDKNKKFQSNASRIYKALTTAAGGVFVILTLSTDIIASYNTYKAWGSVGWAAAAALLYKILEGVTWSVGSKRLKKASTPRENKIKSFEEKLKEISEASLSLKDELEVHENEIKRLGDKISELDETLSGLCEYDKYPTERARADKFKAETLEKYGGSLERIIKYADTPDEYFCLVELLWENYILKYKNTVGTTDYDKQYMMLKSILTILDGIKKDSVAARFYVEEPNIRAELDAVSSEISPEMKKTLRGDKPVRDEFRDEISAIKKSLM